MTGLPVPLADAPELLARTREGDHDAFATLVGTYQPRVFRWALALTGDIDSAEDITQETFVAVHRKLAGFRGDGPFEAWLYRITRRIAMRGETRARQTTVRPAASTTDEVYVTDPGARVDRQRAIALVATIARTLPMRQREVFVLCDIEGRTPAEAAVMLAMKDVSVRASLFKARAAIRRTFSSRIPATGSNHHDLRRLSRHAGDPAGR